MESFDYNVRQYTPATIAAVLIALINDLTVLYFIKCWLERQQRIDGNRPTPKVVVTSRRSIELGDGSGMGDEKEVGLISACSGGSVALPGSNTRPASVVSVGSRRTFVNNGSFGQTAEPSREAVSKLKDPIVQVYTLVVAKCTMSSVMLKATAMLASSPTKLLHNRWGLLGHWILIVQISLLYLTATVLLDLLMTMTDRVVNRSTRVATVRHALLLVPPLVSIVAFSVARVEAPLSMVIIETVLDGFYALGYLIAAFYVPSVIHVVVPSKMIWAIRAACCYIVIAFILRAALIHITARFIDVFTPGNVLPFQALLSGGNYLVLFGAILIFRMNSSS